MLRADWASPARKATPAHAIPAGRASKVTGASGDIVARF
jgi:hypothetical protein